MTLTAWLGLVLLFFTGGLTPGPAVLLVMASAMRHGVRAAMIAGVGIAAANWAWIGLAISGALAIAVASPLLFNVIRLVGIGVILWLAARTALSPPRPLDPHLEDAPRRSRLFVRGVALQLSNPSAFVFFALLLPPFFNPDAPIAPQALLVAVTVTVTELFGLFVYALAADAMARRFASPRFARGFAVCAGLAMALSACVALLATAR